MINEPFFPRYGTGVSVTTSATATPFVVPPGSRQIIVTNLGTTGVYVRLTGGAVAVNSPATAADFLVAPAAIITLGVPVDGNSAGAANGSAISPAGAGSLYVIGGHGY